MKGDCHNEKAPEGSGQCKRGENAMRGDSPEQWRGNGRIIAGAGNQSRQLVKAKQVLIQAVTGNDDGQANHRNGQRRYRVESSIKKESSETIVSPQSRDQFKRA